MWVLSLKATAQTACDRSQWLQHYMPIGWKSSVKQDSKTQIYCLTLLLLCQYPNTYRCVFMHVYAHNVQKRTCSNTASPPWLRGLQCATSGDVFFLYLFVQCCLEALRKHWPLTWLAWSEWNSMKDGLECHWRKQGFNSTGTERAQKCREAAPLSETCTCERTLKQHRLSLCLAFSATVVRKGLSGFVYELYRPSINCVGSLLPLLLHFGEIKVGRMSWDHSLAWAPQRGVSCCLDKHSV